MTYARFSLLVLALGLFSVESQASPPQRCRDILQFQPARVYKLTYVYTEEFIQSGDMPWDRFQAKDIIQAMRDLKDTQPERARRIGLFFLRDGRVAQRLDQREAIRLTEALRELTDANEKTILFNLANYLRWRIDLQLMSAQDLLGVTPLFQNDTRTLIELFARFLNGEYSTSQKYAVLMGISDDVIVAEDWAHFYKEFAQEVLSQADLPHWKKSRLRTRVEAVSQL